MSILKNNDKPFTALNNVKKLSKEEIIEAIKVAGIKEYGIYNDRLVSDIWNTRNFKNDKPEKIICGLNNNDTEHVLLEILKENPYGVIEGLAIAAHVINTKSIEINIPKEDALLIHKIEEISKEYDLSLTVQIGMIDVRAAKDSIIHHIETAAAMTTFFSDTQKYEKTTVIALKTGETKISKLMEISYGKTIGSIINTDNQDIKAIGVGSKVYDSSALNLIIDEKFPLQNGVITVFDEKTCMADQAEKHLLALKRMGCGKCTFCREGNIQIHARMKDITKGKGKTDDFPMIHEIGEAMKYSCLCSVGQAGADFVLDSLRCFKDEIEAHIRKKQCPAEVCDAFTNIYIDPLKCDACGECIDVCPEDCIEGKRKYIHMIDEFDCSKCGKCIDVCPIGAIVKTTGRVPKLPERLTKVGRFKKR